MIEDASHDVGFVGMLEDALLQDLRTASQQGINSSINLAIRGDNGDLKAGLSATTSYGWVHVNIVWVSQEHWFAGLGRQLVQHAFDIALKRQCHSVWLDTSNRRARIFYEAMGFTRFGVLENGADAHPQEHSRWFLCRPLRASNDR